MTTQKNNLKELAKLVRYYIIRCTTAAGSGHPSSSLSATDLMTTLLFGGFFAADLNNPSNPTNDRLIFSKGHASPLFYSLYAAAGQVSEKELLTLRQFGSRLEGHPTMEFPYTEAATGSLGQGLSIGLGMALNAKLNKLDYNTFVLLGDSEMAEGSVWEALQIAAHYKLNNLIGILDVNRLGQRGETMYGHHADAFAQRVSSFGWKTIVVDGHNLDKITAAYAQAFESKDAPVMIIAKTVKGKGVQLMEDKDGWHGKAMKPPEALEAIKGLGKIDLELSGVVLEPENTLPASLFGEESKIITKKELVPYQLGDKVATRKAYGNALVRLYPQYPNMVVLDAETSNSTYAEFFKQAHPERFFEMYIAEQNMVGTALGLSRRGNIPFVSTFAAFFSRAADQIRMSQYANSNLKFVGSHAGVSIGEDGASQMALEDIALFRCQLDSVVLYPSDAMATEKLVAAAAEHEGNVYLRTTRAETPVIYSSDEPFMIGGSKVVRESKQDVVTIVGAGITLFEALKAYDILQKEAILVRVIDLYSIKPLDVATLKRAAQETKALIVVEDHFVEGGIGEAVMAALAECQTPVYSLAVKKLPRSGKPEELLAYAEIDCQAIVRLTKTILEI